MKQLTLLKPETITTFGKTASYIFIKHGNKVKQIIIEPNADREMKTREFMHYIGDVIPDGCPICGDYEGDAMDCPNGCHDH